MQTTLEELITLHPNEDIEKLKIWACELDIAKKIVEVCSKYNLKIWAEGGTMLGAVRHRGFIPWDDDIDFMMLRPDYEKLLSVAQAEFDYPYFFQTAYTDKNYIRGHAQVRNSETSAILPYDIWQEFNQGVFVDIFVYDDVPINKEERQELYDKIETIRGKLIGKAYGTFLAKNPIKMINKWMDIKGISILEEYKKMESILSVRNITEKSIVNFAAFNTRLDKRFTTPIEWLDETIFMDFENISIPIPKQYDKLLTTRFGDYMEPRKETSQHGTVIFDLDKSYKEVLSQLRSEASFKEKLKNRFNLR